MTGWRILSPDIRMCTILCSLLKVSLGSYNRSFLCLRPTFWAPNVTEPYLRPTFCELIVIALLPSSSMYTLCKPLVDVTGQTLGEIVAKVCFYRFYATSWALIEISFSGRLGLSQMRLRITSQLFSNNFTTLIFVLHSSWWLMIS
jgi:hypothetical protein